MIHTRIKQLVPSLIILLPSYGFWVQNAEPKFVQVAIK